MSYIEGNGPWTEGMAHRDDGTTVVEGFVHRIRDMGGFTFLVIRTGRAMVQCVMEESLKELSGRSLETGDTVRLEGEKVTEPRAAGGFEIRIRHVEILSRPCSQPLLSLIH